MNYSGVTGSSTRAMLCTLIIAGGSSLMLACSKKEGARQAPERISLEIRRSADRAYTLPNCQKLVQTHLTSQGHTVVVMRPFHTDDQAETYTLIDLDTQDHIYSQAILQERCVQPPSPMP